MPIPSFAAPNATELCVWSKKFPAQAEGRRIPPLPEACRIIVEAQIISFAVGAEVCLSLDSWPVIGQESNGKSRLACRANYQRVTISLVHATKIHKSLLEIQPPRKTEKQNFIRFPSNAITA
jgi:hypothetical protein